MSQKIKAYIINKNLLTTLKDTVTFLSKEPRIEIIIYDKQSTYPPLLNYYKTCSHKIIISKDGEHPHSVFSIIDKKENYIVADSDCSYFGVPSNWLDVMLSLLEDQKEYDKIGMSLDIFNLILIWENAPLEKEIVEWEGKFWETKYNDKAFIADVDTTFAIYRANTGFVYKALRLDTPYTINHVPWLLSPPINEEWKYYLEHAGNASTWGNKLKSLL